MFPNTRYRVVKHLSGAATTASSESQFTNFRYGVGKFLDIQDSLHSVCLSLQILNEGPATAVLLEAKKLGAEDKYHLLP